MTSNNPSYVLSGTAYLGTVLQERCRSTGGCPENRNENHHSKHNEETTRMNHSKTVSSIEELSECIWYGYQSVGISGDGMAYVERGQGLPLPDTLISSWFCKRSATGHSWIHQQIWRYLWEMIFKRRGELFVFKEWETAVQKPIWKKKEEMLQDLKQRISCRSWQKEDRVHYFEYKARWRLTQCMRCHVA